MKPIQCSCDSMEVSHFKRLSKRSNGSFLVKNYLVSWAARQLAITSRTFYWAELSRKCSKVTFNILRDKSAKLFQVLLSIEQHLVVCISKKLHSLIKSTIQKGKKDGEAKQELQSILICLSWVLMVGRRDFFIESHGEAYASAYRKSTLG